MKDVCNALLDLIVVSFSVCLAMGIIMIGLILQFCVYFLIPAAVIGLCGYVAYFVFSSLILLFG